MPFPKDLMYRKFQLYGFLKNLRFFDPFIILFFREMGLSFLQIGILYSIREISTNVLEIPTGVIADSFGRRRSMILSFSSYLVSFLLFYAFHQFWVYALAMVAFAFGETFRSGTHKAMILEYLRMKGMEGEKVAYYGHTRAASQFGSAIASLIAASLVFYAGSFRIVFLASTVPYVIGLFLLASYPKELDGVGGGVRREGLSRMFATGKEFLSVLKSPLLLRGLFSSASFDAAFKATKDYLQPILRSQALAIPIFLSLSGERRVAVLVGALYFIIYIATSFASSRAGLIERRVRSLPYAVNITYLIGLGLLAAAGGAAWGGIPGIAIGAYLGVYALQNVRRPLVVGYLSERMPHRTMATGLSVESQLKTILMAALAPLIGLLADRLGVGPAIGIIAIGGLSLIPLISVREGR